MGKKPLKHPSLKVLLLNERVITSNENAQDSLTKIYLGAKALELEISYGKRGRLQAKMFGQGKTNLLSSEERGTKK